MLSDVVDAIMCLITALANIIVGSIVAFINLMILALSGWIDALVLLLPAMPDAPEGNPPAVLAWVNWLYPLGAVVELVAVLLALWLAVIGVRACLRMLRVL